MFLLMGPLMSNLGLKWWCNSNYTDLARMCLVTLELLPVTTNATSRQIWYMLI